MYSGDECCLLLCWSYTIWSSCHFLPLKQAIFYKWGHRSFICCIKKNHCVTSTTYNCRVWLAFTQLSVPLSPENCLHWFVAAWLWLCSWSEWQIDQPILVTYANDGQNVQSNCWKKKTLRMPTIPNWREKHFKEHTGSHKPLLQFL